MIRHSPLKDVAGMLRSFHYAAYVAYYFDETGVPLDGADAAAIESWYQSVCRQFLSIYTQQLDVEAFQLGDPDEFRFLLAQHMLEKAVYELGYELNSRPGWAIIPLEGISSILKSPNVSPW
jgi:maltose alpha-D-glucosyltransferase/alpha-amylase